MSDLTPTVVAKLLRERRTVHEFTPDPVESSLIADAIELARWAPNHHRTEPWHFYVLDYNTGMRLAALNGEIVAAAKGEKIAAVKRKRWSEMPGWLVVSCVKSDEEIRAREDYAACACAIQNMSLYLWEQGVGMKWTTGEVTRNPGFFNIVGMDFEHEYVVGLLWYGYPALVPTQHRKAPEEILSYVTSKSEQNA
ncbi:MAG: nitroreductase [Proteobacteria bacterium]|nr:nitroreductase [Pseudomonadota bacterium]